MRANVIDNGAVVNTIEVESLNFMPNLIDASLGGTIGDLWDGVQFTKPPRFTSLDEAVTDRLAELASIRFQRETAGITVNGSTICTDRESQATLTGAWVAVQINPNILIDWKAETGWVQIDKATVEALSAAVGSYVQGCFTAEKNHAAAIAALTSIADVETYDITQGWPL